MGQKVHPLGFRVGITQPHKSSWFAKPSKYPLLIQEDKFIRDFISSTLSQVGISEILIQRRLDGVKIHIHSARPKKVIGQKGKNVRILRQLLSDKLPTSSRKCEISIQVSKAVYRNSNAKLLAEYIGDELEKRVPFRKVVKEAISDAQNDGVKGVKVQISGRLNGAEIARTEWIREGQVPLQTLQADIGYCSHHAQTIYGILGVKVWVYS